MTVIDLNHIVKNTSIKNSNLEIDEFINKLSQIEKQKKELSNQEQLIKDKIISYMGNYTQLKSNTDKTVTLKTQTRKTFNSKLLKEQEPSIYDKFLVEKTMSVFRIVKNKS